MTERKLCFYRICKSFSHTISDNSFCCQCVNRTQNRIVLQIRNDYMIARAQKAFNHCIQCMSTILGKSNLFNIFRPKKRCCFFPDFINAEGCLSRQFMTAAARICTIPQQSFIHRIFNTHWFWKCGSGIIKINHPSTPLNFHNLNPCPGKQVDSSFYIAAYF